MSLEGQLLDRKSLRTVTGRTADFGELAKDCVAFAAAQGGRLLIGIEDDQLLPPAEQRIKPELLDVIRKRIAENTVGVEVVPRIVTAENGGGPKGPSISLILCCCGPWISRAARPSRGSRNTGCMNFLRDLEIYREASISEIHGRIGEEIPRRLLKNQLRKMAATGEIGRKGKLRHTRYLWTK